MNRRIRIAAVGLGWVAQNRHLPAIRRNPAFALTGLVDRHVGRAETLAQRLGCPLHAETDDLSNVDWLDEVDAVSIGAPPANHAALVCAALDRGKHVLTEKPFALSLPDGEKMAAAARKAEKSLAIVHNFQFSRAARKLDADLAAGSLGPLTRIAAVQWGNPARRLPVWHEDLPLGLFFDESPHFFYLLRKWGGALSLQKAHQVSSHKGKNTPALVHLLYKGATDLPITIDCHFESAVSEWHIAVMGEKSVGLVDVFRDIYIHLPNDNRHNAPDILRTSCAAVVQHAVQHIPNGFAFLRGHLDYGNDEVFDRFARSVKTGKKPENIDAEAALDVLRIQTDAIRALQENLCP